VIWTPSSLVFHFFRAKQTEDTGRCPHKTSSQGFRASSGIRAGRVTAGLYVLQLGIWKRKTLAPTAVWRARVVTYVPWLLVSTTAQTDGARHFVAGKILGYSPKFARDSERALNHFVLSFCPDKLGRQDSGSSCCGPLITHTALSLCPAHGYTQSLTRIALQVR